MKKVMIGLLVLIPVIILVVVQAVSAVVSTRTHIGVESVTFDAESVEIAFENKEYSAYDFLNVEVLPERATDRSVTWSISDLKCLDNDYEAKWNEYVLHGDDEDYSGETVNDPAVMLDGDGNAAESNSTGRFKLFSYCSFYLEAQAETQKARCLVYVGGYSVRKAVLSGDNNIKTGESTLLSVNCTPVDSILVLCTWSSSDESVATVDDNGVVTGVGAGEAEITATVKSPDTNYYVDSDAFTVTVSASVTLLGDKLTLGADGVTLTALGIEESDVVSLVNCSITDGVLTVTNELAPASVTTANGTATITVCGDNDIKIENGNVFGYDSDRQDGFVLAVGDLPLQLSAVWSNVFKDGTPSVTWTSSRNTVATVDAGGKVVGVGRGLTVITATAEIDGETYTATLNLSVENKVTSLQLAVTDNSLAVGIARETVFASERYADNTLTTHAANGLMVRVLRPSAPTDLEEAQAFYDAFTFSVFEKDADGKLVASTKAVFDGNVLTFVPSEITERTDLTVRVEAKYPKYAQFVSYTVASFTLTVVDGLAVNSYKSLVAAAAENEVISFEKNVQMLDGDTTPFTELWQGTVFVRNDVYGNAYMYSAAYQQMVGYTSMLEISEDNVTVSNITIRSNEVEEEITDVEGSSGLKGKSIGAGCFVYSSGRMLRNVRVEYSILENGSGCLNVWGTEIFVEGCIMRNTSGCAVYAAAERAGDRLTYSYVTVKNCVMSNMIGTGFSFPYLHYSVTGDEASIAQAKEDVAAGRNLKFVQLGFLDIYNWQSVDVLNLIDIDGLDQKYKDLINSFARNEIASNPAFDPFFNVYNGVKYFHMGFLTNGFTEPTYLEPEMEDTRFKMITTEVISIQAIANMPPIKFYSYGGDETQIPPGKTYSVNSKLIDKLHGNY